MLNEDFLGASIHSHRKKPLPLPQWLFHKMGIIKPLFINPEILHVMTLHAHLHFQFQEYLWQLPWWSACSFFCFPHLFSPNLLLASLIVHLSGFVFFSSPRGSFPDIYSPKLLALLASYPCTISRDPAWIRCRNGNDRGGWNCSAHGQENLVRFFTWRFKSLQNLSSKITALDRVRAVLVLFLFLAK